MPTPPPSSTLLTGLVERLESTTSRVERLSLLQAIARHLVPIDPESALTYLRTVIDAAGEMRRHHDRAEALETTGAIHAGAGRWKQSLTACRAARAAFEKVGESAAAARLAVRCGRAERNLGHYVGAADQFDDAEELYGDAAGRAERLTLAKERGDLYATIGDATRALPYYLDAYRLCEEEEIPQERGLALSDLGIIHAELGESDTALDYLERSLECYRACGAFNLEARALANIAALHTACDRLDKALDCGVRAMALHEALDDRSGLAATLLNLSHIHERQGSAPAAIDCRLKAFDIFEEIDDPHGQARTLLALGTLYNDLGREHDAAYVLEHAARIAEERRDHAVACEAYRARAAALESMGDAAGGLRLLHRYITLRRRLDDEERRTAVAEVRTRFELERTAREREILRLKALQLEAETRRSNAELNALSLQLVEKEKFIEGLLERMREIERSAPEQVKPLAGAMIGEIKRSVAAGDTWGSFEEQFEKIHRGLMGTIAARFPTLTQNELKHCALIATGLSTGEIATLLKITTRTVETTRYRIRKEIGIDSKIDLGVYLQGLDRKE